MNTELEFATDELALIYNNKLSVQVYRYAKRVIDIFLAIIMLIVLAIPMTVISLLIKLESKGPAFFVQERTGKNGKVFKMYKFRSMTCDNDVHDFKTENKLTRMGKFIRKTSLDELPQLFNIVKGDMSFIGPRPWITEYYDSMNEYQRHRYDVLPGITGLAQVKGRNAISIFQKIQYDLNYVEKFSFIMDVKVLWYTVSTVLSSKGADMPKFGIRDEVAQLKDFNVLYHIGKTVNKKNNSEDTLNRIIEARKSNLV